VRVPPLRLFSKRSPSARAQTSAVAARLLLTFPDGAPAMSSLLIIDSEEDLLWALSKNLFKPPSPVAIHTASSGEKALELLQQRTFQLILVDPRLGGTLDGFNLLLRAKDLAPQSSVLVMTAFKTREERAYVPPMGVLHYISKPFDIEQLRKQVLGLLDDAASSRGVLGDMALADILMLSIICQRTSLLHLHHARRRGRIELKDGEFQHAEFDSKKGPEAAWTMLGLKDGDIFMQGDYKASPRSIQQPWHGLFSDAARWLEEHGPVAYEASEVDIPVEGWDDAPAPASAAGSSQAAHTLGEDAAALLGFSDEELQEISLDPSEAGLDDPNGFHFPPPEEETLPRAPRLRPQTEPSAPRPRTPSAVTATSRKLSLTPPGGPVPMSSLAQPPTLVTPPPLPPAPAAPPRDRGRAEVSIGQLLSQFKAELTSLVSAEVLDEQGTLLAAIAAADAPNHDHDASVAFYAPVIAAARRAAAACGDAARYEALQITTAQHYVLARLIPGTDCAQLVTLRRDANLGLAQVIMRRADAAFAGVLS
jgi:DNA-binding response OmpR family regulator/predicted regulator of Ras-like GTPase activity (Roadblock/LC7/MglB family)